MKLQKRFFTSDQHAHLESIFAVNPKPSAQEIRKIAKQLDVEFIKVKGWFYRQKCKYMTSTEGTKSHI